VRVHRCQPGLRSYSLGNLCAHYGIEFERHHRAMRRPPRDYSPSPWWQHRHARLWPAAYRVCGRARWPSSRRTA